MRHRATRSLILSAILFCLDVILAATSQGFTLIPISMDFEPSGRGAIRNFRIENPTAEPVAVQITLVTREMDLDGKETYTPATNDFTIYPPQAVVQPKQSQAVRVIWTGDARPVRELNYRIVAEQLPVNLKKETTPGGAVNLIVRYLGTIYIVPKGAQPDIVVESSTVEKSADGKAQLVLMVNNRGTAHGLLSDLKVKITAGDKTMEITGEDQLKGMFGENMLCGHKRRFKIPCPPGFEDQPVRATLEYNLNR